LADLETAAELSARPHTSPAATVAAAACAAIFVSRSQCMEAAALAEQTYWSVVVSAGGSCVCVVAAHASGCPSLLQLLLACCSADRLWSINPSKIN